MEGYSSIKREGGDSQNRSASPDEELGRVLDRILSGGGGRPLALEQAAILRQALDEIKDLTPAQRAAVARKLQRYNL
jgi:hypothetical protein